MTRALAALGLVAADLRVGARRRAVGADVCGAGGPRCGRRPRRCSKHLGWDIDKADRAIGWITTESRRVEGEDYGVYEKGLRHRLRLHLKAAGEGKTIVSVERTVFKRERILSIDKDEPVNDPSQAVEKAVLDAIGKASVIKTLVLVVIAGALGGDRPRPALQGHAGGR